MTEIASVPLSARRVPPHYRQAWSIGMYAGPSPTTLTPLPGNPVLTRQDVTDVTAAFIADPFMLPAQGFWAMFFEVLEPHLDKGMIGLATSDDGVRWHYQQIVLAEPFHLSYPYVFAWQGDYYMVPESHQAGAVRLYRALSFPTSWAYVTTLLHGPYLVDPSLLYYHDRWWLFAETSTARQHDTLRLYQAAELDGPWSEHPCSPLIVGNAHRARPAGRITLWQDRLLRFAQDCHPIYGQHVYAFDVALTPETYHERVITRQPILRGSGAGWNAIGMHHLDPHLLPNGRWVACVDGFQWGARLPC
jgi:hypothetical protein